MYEQDIPALLETIRTALFTGQISAAKVDAQRALVLLENRIDTIVRVARETPELCDCGRAVIIRKICGVCDNDD